MNILISGGTGFVGKALVSKLVEFDNQVSILTRHPEKFTNTANVTYITIEQLKELTEIDAVVNLAGETINGRWTSAKKEKILKSRLETTNKLINYLAQLPNKPKVFINASAIGYYGISKDREFTEETVQPGDDFLATVVSKWEQAALRAEDLGIRTVLTRFGVILGKKAGALPKMLLPYKLFIGGPIGSGRHWISWVHIDDVVGMIEFCIQNEAIKGAVNVTAPTPVKMKDFGRAIGKVLQRPHWLPTPQLPLKLILGEMSILVLEGQNVKPEKATRHGYDVKYKTLEAALQNLLH
jgi:uncharacterized protein